MPTQTISEIKHQDYTLPPHWVSDWLLYVLQKPATFLITDRGYSLSDSEQTKFNEGIVKMQAGTPLAYLTGTQAFWSLEFIVNEHTLIPRPDTEVLVEQVLNWIAKQGEVSKETRQNSLSNIGIDFKETTDPAALPNQPIKHLLDLGTGSGCIAISLAYELGKPNLKQNSNQCVNQWQVTAIDYSQQALNMAKRNATHNQVSNIEFYQSDWFAVFETDDTYAKYAKLPQFEVIVSNPPYIDPTDDHLQQLKAEPLTALVADDKGLADIKLICTQATDYLVKGGLLAIEHGHDQGSSVREIFMVNGYSEVQTIQDYGGNDRVTLGVWR